MSFLQVISNSSIELKEITSLKMGFFFFANTVYVMYKNIANDF